MSLSEMVLAQLEAERKSKMTHQQIAYAHNISTSYVTNLLNKKRPVGGITLDTFEQMFPNARLALDNELPSMPIGKKQEASPEPYVVGYHMSGNASINNSKVKNTIFAGGQDGVQKDWKKTALFLMENQPPRLDGPVAKNDFTGLLDAYRGRLYSAVVGLGLDAETLAKVARCIREA